MAKLTGQAKKAFLRKMAAGRAKARRRRNPARRAVHTAKFDRCVKDVRRRARGGKRASNPYAVCSASLGRRAVKPSHRRNPSARGFVLIATRVGSKPLAFEGGKFSSQARAIRFADRAGAQRAAHAMRSQYALLRKWRLSVIPADKWHPEAPPGK